MANISEVAIENFMSIDSKNVCSKLEQGNLFVGPFAELKKDIWKTIIFALGATLEDLGVTGYAALKNHADAPTSVKLTLKYNNVDYTVERTLNDGDEQVFLIGKDPITGDDIMEQYQTFLKGVKFDMSKQILLCDSRNVELILNKLLTTPYSLIGAITGLAKQIEAKYKYRQTIAQQTKIKEDLDDGLIKMKDDIKHLESALPEFQTHYSAGFAAYTISLLKRQQAERTVKKDEYATVRDELNAIQADIQNSKAIIARETTLRDQKAFEKQELRTQIATGGPVPKEDQESLLLCNKRKFRLEQMLEKQRILKDKNIDLYKKLMHQKEEVESNITCMTGASGTNQKSHMIPGENLRNLYPLYHGKDELEMDKLAFQLLKTESQLKIDANVQETFDCFEALLPQRKSKEMEKDKTIPEILLECNAALKDVFHPNAYMQPTDELKLEKLRSLIPSDKGFLFCDCFKAIAEEHRLLIEHILIDYTYTIVLFKDHQQFIWGLLQKECPERYANVNFLVLDTLPGDHRGDYVAPPDHWLNYCNFTNTNIDLETRRKLMFYAGKQLEIRRVATHDEVKEAFQGITKKYVASVDGQLIYTKHSMGFDVIKYFKPGKKVTEMQFPAACQRLEGAVHTLSELMSTFVETENIPRDRPASNTNEIGIEAERLRKDIAEKEERMNAQLKDLRIRLNAPCESPNVHNYADELAAEQRKLDDIKDRVMPVQNEAFQQRQKLCNLTADRTYTNTYIENKHQLDTCELDIVKHNKTIRTNEQQLKELLKTVARLQLKTEDLKETIQNLKYETVKTVLRAHQANVDWTAVDWAAVVTEPPTLWQDIQNGIFVDPTTISTHFDDMTDTFDPDVFYANHEWCDALERNRNMAKVIVGKINDAVTALDAANRRYTNLKTVLGQNFLELSMNMTVLLNEIGGEVHPNAGIEYNFSINADIEYNFNAEYDGSAPAEVIQVKIGGNVVGFHSLSKPEIVRISWVLFLALNEYAATPLALMDLDEIDKEAVPLLNPIALQMSRKAQLFIDSSSVHYTHFAQMHYGINAKIQADGPNAGRPENVIIISHDGRLFVKNIEDNEDSFDGQDERAGEGVDNNDRGDESAGERVDNNDRGDERTRLSEEQNLYEEPMTNRILILRKYDDKYHSTFC